PKASHDAASQLSRAAELLTGGATVERVRPIVDVVLETEPLDKLPRETVRRIVAECRRRASTPSLAIEPKTVTAEFDDAFDAILLARGLGVEIEPPDKFVEAARNWARHFRDAKTEEWTLGGVDAFLLAARRMENHYAGDAMKGATILRRRHPELAPALREVVA